MKLEQMSETPEQPNNERKETTPEKAEAMTLERRNWYGLGKSRELTPEEAEKVEADIKKLLEGLDAYDFYSFDQAIQEEWDWVEIEATSGNDRELARAVLKRFLGILRGPLSASLVQVNLVRP